MGFKTIIIKGEEMFLSYWVYYLLGFIMLPGIILGIYAQTKVYSTFNQFNKSEAKSGRKAKDVARSMLDGAGYNDIIIKPIRGELTDNFDPRNNTVSLSENVYENPSISAIGVACHEIGHVFQHKENYAPIKARNALVPVMNFLGYITWPLIIVGIIMEMFYLGTSADVLLYLGVGTYGLNVIFCLITLPIELNASKRAYKMLLATHEMDEEEAEGVKKVLNAAALTYVAALITSVLSLIRLLLFAFAFRRND